MSAGRVKVINQNGITIDYVQWSIANPYNRKAIYDYHSLILRPKGRIFHMGYDSALNTVMGTTKYSLPNANDIIKLMGTNITVVDDLGRSIIYYVKDIKPNIRGETLEVTLDLIEV